MLTTSPATAAVAADGSTIAFDVLMLVIAVCLFLLALIGAWLSTSGEHRRLGKSIVAGATVGAAMLIVTLLRARFFGG